MKTTIQSKALLILFLLPAFILASVKPKNAIKHKKEKTIKKSFNVKIYSMMLY